MATWLASRRVVLGGGGLPLRLAPAALRIEGTHIAELRELDDASYGQTVGSLGHDGTPVEDFGERLLSPAFVDAHTHLALIFLRGATTAADNLVEDVFFEHERRLQAEDVRAFTRVAAYEALLSGTGFVWDHYYHGLAVAQGMADAGLTGAVAPTLQDLEGPGATRSEAELQATLDLDCDAWRERGMFAALGPHATDTVSDDLMQRVLQLAVQRDLPIHMHCAQSLDEMERLQHRRGTTPLGWLEGLRVLEHAPSLVLAHALFATERDLGRLDPERHALVFCPHAQLVFGFPAPVDRWDAYGLRWAIATDCTASNDSHGLQKELRLTANIGRAPVAWSAVHRQFMTSGDLQQARQVWASRPASYPAAPLLERAWATAGSLHPAVRTGVLAPGALANLVVWNLDHPGFWPAVDPLHGLCMGDTAGAIHSLFTAGRQRGEAGDFARSILASGDYRSAVDEAQARLDSLRRSA